MPGTTVEATFAFVDLAGYTALTEVHGDAHAFAIVQAFKQRTLDAMQSGDHLVKTIGDAVMLAFPTPRAAITALRRLLTTELVHEDAVLLPRAGAHHGRALAIDGDFYGGAVNLAARVSAHATPGQLLVTSTPAVAARDEGAVVTHVGAVELRNVSDPIDIYDIVVGRTTTSTAVDPVCHMRVPSDGDTGVTLMWDGRAVRFCGLPCVARFAADPRI